MRNNSKNIKAKARKETRIKCFKRWTFLHFIVIFKYGYLIRKLVVEFRVGK